jgi:hypothetical protein
MDANASTFEPCQAYLMDHLLPPFFREVDVEVGICWIKTEYLYVVDLNYLGAFGGIYGVRLLVDMLNFVFFVHDSRVGGSTMIFRTWVDWLKDLTTSLRWLETTMRRGCFIRKQLFVRAEAIHGENRLLTPDLIHDCGGSR